MTVAEGRVKACIHARARSGQWCRGGEDHDQKENNRQETSSEGRMHNGPAVSWTVVGGKSS